MCIRDRLWEIRRFYSREYQIGQYALQMIRERLQVDLPEDEAGFIALHFINAEYGTDITLRAAFPAGGAEPFAQRLTELSAGSLTMTAAGEEFLPGPREAAN